MVKKTKTISNKSLQKAIETVEKLAGSTSQIAYVYPYLDSNISKVNEHLNKSRHVNTRGSKSGKALVGSKSAKNSKSGKALVGSKSVKNSKSGKSLVGAKSVKVKSKKKWAVRVEGNSAPVKKSFNSKNLAVDHAKGLLAKGKAKQIKIVNK